MVHAIRATNFTAEDGGSKLGDVIWRFADNSTRLKKKWVLSEQKIDSLMLAIFREIDETVLPREIALTTNANVVLRLLVASRRLLSLEIVGNLEQPDQTETGVTETGATGSGDSEDIAQVNANRLQSVLEQSSEIHIQITPRDLVSASNRKSCSAYSLAASVGLPLRAAEPSENINEFFLNVEKLATASVRFQRKSNQTDKQGNDSLTDLLMTVAERSYGDARKSGPSAGFGAVKPFCSVFRLNESMSVLVAHDSDEKVLFVMPPNKVRVAMALWQEIFATSK